MNHNKILFAVGRTGKISSPDNSAGEDILHHRVPMVSSKLIFDPRFQEAIRLFDDAEFFACHDLLEEIWSETLDESRQFLQGLIHAAISLFHFGERNLGGARKMCDSTRRYLSPFLPVYAGIDLDGFLQAYVECFQELLDIQSGYPEHVQLNLELIPRLGAFCIADASSEREDS